jgi:hypothetical protein
MGIIGEDDGPDAPPAEMIHRLPPVETVEDGPAIVGDEAVPDGLEQAVREKMDMKIDDSAGNGRSAVLFAFSTSDRCRHIFSGHFTSGCTRFSASRPRHLPQAQRA